MTASRLGATPRAGEGCEFRVWAPGAHAVHIVIESPQPREIPLRPAPRGYHEAMVGDVHAGARYRVRVDDGEPRPDPASRSQPDGVHGASEVVDLTFPWSDDAWRGPAMENLVVYELHVGTFTRDGTFDAIVPRLASLRELGVTAIELMPVAQFPGTRNWGYDGVCAFAVQHSYGGVRGLQRLVDACHATGLGVLLDVVYNHLGPEGNHLGEFGPYFTDAYHTPWGPAINFDGAHSDEVRHYFIESALQWIDECHCDGLRLDATHAIHDRSARPFLEELPETVHARAERRGRRVLVIAETDQNDPRYVRPVANGGLGMDGMWCDDLHHTLHTALTGERSGYYRDFGALDLLASAWASGMGYTGQWSEHRRRRHGRPPIGVAPFRFVVCSQNHDQVGNRAQGDRMSALVDPRALPLAAAVVLTSPCTPLLFMGEEHGERHPFLYFTSHGDPDLVEAVRKGRREEFAAFGWEQDVPDPQAEATFDASVLSEPDAIGRELRERYRELLSLRDDLPDGPSSARAIGDNLVLAERGEGTAAIRIAFHFAPEARDVDLDLPDGRWLRRWDSAGAASAVPDSLEAPAQQSVRLAPWQAVVFARAQ